MSKNYIKCITANEDVDKVDLNQLKLPNELSKMSKELKICGGYRSRTDDPLRARQMLWPAELTPQV